MVFVKISNTMYNVMQTINAMKLNGKLIVLVLLEVRP